MCVGGVFGSHRRVELKGWQKGVASSTTSNASSHSWLCLWMETLAKRTDKNALHRMLCFASATLNSFSLEGQIIVMFERET